MSDDGVGANDAMLANPCTNDACIFANPASVAN